MKNKYKFAHSSISPILYYLLIIILPITTLVIGGLIYLWQQGLLLYTLLAWLVVSVVAYLALIYWPKFNEEKNHREKGESLPKITDSSEISELPERLSAQSYWSSQDHEVWNRACLAIEKQLEINPEWEALPDIALQQLALIAEQYHGKSKSAQYRFTVPEVLLVISVTSSRYRQLVIEYVPYIDKFTVARASTLFDQKSNINTGYLWFNRIRRTARLINPASAIVGELRDLLADKIYSKASHALQNDLKRLLLQEVTQVGIDLYSGKLSASNDELASYQSVASRADKHRKADVAEPTRVLILGQTSVGKSSLINALTDTLQGEVGVLPVTDRLTVHELDCGDGTLVSLVDSPGIDGSDDMHAELLSAALDADLIIWIAKATQPARAPDKELNDALQAHYAVHPEKLQAPVIMVLTHIDQLSPKAQWEPPYDLSSDQAKVQSIRAAVESARSKIGFSEDTLVIPVYLGVAPDFYNVDTLAAQVIMLSGTSAANVQLNRRRIELGSNAKDWQAHWTQAKKLGRVIGKSIAKGI